MKRSKRITAILLGLMTLILLLPARVLGLGALNTEQEASLTISSQDGDIPLVGQRFDLYLVAEPDENGQLTATEQFRNFDLNIDGTDEDGWKALASTLNRNRKIPDCRWGSQGFQPVKEPPILPWQNRGF